MFHEKQESIQKNQHCYLIAASAYMVLTGILSDGFVQAYMNKLGMTAQTIGLYGALAQIAAMLAYAFSTSFLNGPTSFQRSYLFTTFGLLAMPVGLFLSHVISTPWIVAFILIAAGMIYQALIAIRNTSEYDLIPYVVPRSNYGILLSRAGVIGGLSAVGLTTLSQSLIDKIGFPQGYDLLFLITALTCFLSGVAVKNLQIVYPAAEPKKTRPKVSTAFRMALRTPRYRIQLLPHLFRGIGNAGLYFFLTIAMQGFSMEARDITLVTILSVTFSAIANFSFSKINRRIHTGVITLISACVCAGCLIADALFHSRLLFFFLYAFYIFANAMNQLGIAVGVMNNTTMEDLPLISALRMLLTTGMASLFTLLFGKLLDSVNALWVVLPASCAFVLCGVLCSKRFTDAIMEK